MYKRSQKMLEMCDLFRSANGHLSYETIEQHFGKSIDEMRPTAYSARKALEKDESIVFECIPKVGYKRLNDSEKIESLKTFTRRIQRTTNNGVRRTNTVEDKNNLSSDERLRLSIKISVFHALQDNLNAQDDKQR
tara:strand:+ start:228 stop:632 length:405 start_codon:yes stop_codon:yes gene_type:complete